MRADAKGQLLEKPWNYLSGLTLRSNGSRATRGARANVRIGFFQTFGDDRARSFILSASDMPRKHRA
jgi:hypothetical protein